MDNFFIKGWFLFVGLLVVVVIGGIRWTAKKPEIYVLLKSSGKPTANPMIVIPAGDFVMGSEEGGRNEQPTRTVSLSVFQINQFEITQYHYGEFIKATGHRSPLSRYSKNVERFNDMNQPVVYVSWLDAEAFCKWQGARLPTEAEWEKAAKGAGTNSWPWGEEPKSIYGNFLGAEDGSPYTAFVGSFSKDQSSYHVYDMAGNAQEWISDWYDELYYEKGTAQNPKGPDRGDMKTLRGGSWNDSYLSGRVAARIKMFPDYRDTTVGFRCAKDVEKSAEQ